jgi:predicted secreted Zn-dependent protease/ribosomal protein L40E
MAGIDARHPTRICFACGVSNLPLAPTCRACGADLRLERLRVEAASRQDRGRGVLILAASLAVAAAVTLAGIAIVPRLMLDRNPAPSAILAAGAGAISTPTVGTPAAAATSSPSPIAAATASPSPAPRATPRPSARPTSRPTPRSTPPPGPDTVSLPTFAAKVPGATTIRFYSVVGDSPNDLARSMLAHGPDHCGVSHAVACVTPRYSRYAVSGIESPATGSCTLTTVRITAAYTVWLPRWTKPARVYPELVAWWKKVLAHLAWHEAHHIGIENARLPNLRDRLLGAPCSRGPAIIKAWAASLDKAQAAFDAKDRSWDWPPYRGPVG